VSTQLVRASFADHEGWEIDTQGDAFFVAFDRVKMPSCALLTYSARLRPMLPQQISPRVRVGLHTTEPHIWSEGYVGVGVHRASRISDVGHGGQVLLSRSTAGLAADEESSRVLASLALASIV
jgi:class 3 adenylate cyclase